MKRMTLKMMAEDFGKTALNLGRADENKAVRIEIDLSNLLEITPDANASITVETPSGKKYPATTSKEGKLLIWDVNSADTAEEGRGWAQLTITGSNDEVLKSVVTATRVGRSIRGEGAAPDPVQNWVDDATSKLGNVVSAGENAKEAAEKAEEAAKRANDAAEKAENGVVQSDYAQNDATQPDYIKNRPGGYYQTVPGVDITWDGVIGDRPKAQTDVGVYLVKVGDEMLAAEQLIGATVTMVEGSENTSMVLLVDNVMSGDGFVMETEGSIISCSKTTFEIDGWTLTLPETGTYFVYREQDGNKTYVSGLTKPETQELVPIPGELTNIKGGYDLPTISNQPVYSGTVPASAFGASTQAATFAEAGVTEKKYSAPITLTNPLAEGATVNGTVNGTAVSGVVAKNSAGDLNAALYTTGASEQVAVVEAGGFGGTLVCILTSDAVMVLGNPPETDMVLALTQSKESTPVQIPAKYLDLGAYVANGDKEFILASSTAGSTKKFKITVDDAGTLSATEVTS